MISVLIATHNGSATLSQALQAYARVAPPVGGHEFIVVDNASTDGTLELARQWTDRLPLTVLHTTERGKNAALNHGIPRARGDLLVFTDDDILPEHDWLTAYEDAARRQPGYDIFAGHIRPVWPEPCPPWILRLIDVGITFGLTPETLREGRIEAYQVWGGNMAIRRHVFDAGNRYDTRFGPSGGQYVMGSETEFTMRLERDGHRSWFVDGSAVGHIIRPHQFAYPWIMGRAVRFGRKMYHDDPPGDDIPTVYGVPRWKLRQYLGEWMRCHRAWLRGDADEQIARAWTLSLLKGYFLEAYAARGPRRAALRQHRLAAPAESRRGPPERGHAPRKSPLRRDE